MALFTNQATLSYRNNVTNSNIVSGELVEVISATKTALETGYQPSDVITYVLNINNAGTSAATGITVTDNLGQYSTGTPSVTVYPLTYRADSARLYINGTAQTAPAIAAGPPLAISDITIPAGGMATLIYQADISQYAPLGTTDSIVNTATVSGTGLNPVEATLTLPALQQSLMTLTKNLSPCSVTENGTITYTLTLSNYGNTAAGAGDNVTITDTFNPVLNLTGVTLDGVAFPATSYTYNTTTGAFATNAGAITVPAATYTQDAATGVVTTTPGTATLVITGTI